ncbi:hypothetical protein [Bizionia sp.]|uniref:hypothetical protein n=1 Tax=Bizionia sp. TaxID=1954480 RepID=UPI003A8E8E7E
MKNIKTYQPDGLSILEDIRRDLLSACSHADNSLSPRILHNLMSKINIAIEVINYQPRLPLHQIEERIKEICKNDKTTHGVTCNFLFTTKYGNIDYSKLSVLNVNV